LKNRTALRIFESLLKTYGERNWWPAKTRFEVIIGTILAQNVSWRNAKKAVDSLKKHGLLSLTAIHKLPPDKIAPLIKPSRFYNQKAGKIKQTVEYVMSRHKGSLNKMFSLGTDVLRRDLLGIKGIGKETADSILLYAGKKRSFVSDAYTKRFVLRYGLLKDL